VRFPTRNPKWDCGSRPSFCGARQPIRKQCSHKVTLRDPCKYIEPKSRAYFNARLSFLAFVHEYLIIFHTLNLS
jgi:hypothetical protein